VTGSDGESLERPFWVQRKTPPIGGAPPIKWAAPLSQQVWSGVHERHCVTFDTDLWYGQLHPMTYSHSGLVIHPQTEKGHHGWLEIFSAKTVTSSSSHHPASCSITDRGLSKVK
jgi:hypothetical protein